MALSRGAVARLSASCGKLASLCMGFQCLEPPRQDGSPFFAMSSKVPRNLALFNAHQLTWPERWPDWPRAASLSSLTLGTPHDWRVQWRALRGFARS